MKRKRQLHKLTAYLITSAILLTLIPRFALAETGDASVTDGNTILNESVIETQSDDVELIHPVKVLEKLGTNVSTYTVSLTAEEGGTVTGDGTYNENESVTVTATANEGYKFDMWCENDIWVSDDASYTFNLTEDRELVAKFKKLYTVTYHANNGTDATDSESVADGSALELTDDIFTYDRCEIQSWNTQADGSGYIYYVNDDITVTDNIELYAQWVLPLNELDSFADTDYEWSGKEISPHNFTMKNGAVLYAGVILPLNNAGEESIITVDGDCEIKGVISHDSNERAKLTIKGNGSLKCNEIFSTKSGDSLIVETDTTVENSLDLGASGGQFSNVVIKNSTLTLNDNMVLLQYLTMEGNSKLNINGIASFHGRPEISLGDDSEIYIGGNGFACVMYKENGTNDAFDALMNNEWLPEGYSFKDYNYGYYLYDEANNLVIDAITIKKKQEPPKPSGGRGGGGGGSLMKTYTVKFETDGGSEVAKKVVARNAKLEEPTAPEKEGFTFGGWYTDEQLSIAYDFDEKVTKSFTLYAKWDEVETEKDDTSSGTSGHNCPSLKFSDLDITQWYHFDTDYVIENDIFKGTTETTFSPDRNITRGMMIAVLYRAEGEPEVTGEATFEDVDKDAYYAKAVIWGQQNGIIKGYSETQYAPEQDILREQIAAIMHRYAQYKGYDVSVGENTNILSYDDFDDISEYAIPSMQWAVGSGMIMGRTETTLNPQDFAKRVEIAAMLHRFIEGNK